MAFDDLTETQHTLILALVKNLISGQYKSNFRALTTFQKGWFIKLEDVVNKQEKRLENFEESDLLDLRKKKYINLTRVKDGYIGSLKSKAYQQYKQDITPHSELDSQADLPHKRESFDSQQLRKIEKTSSSLLAELQKSYDLSRHQAALWFWWSLGSASFGIILLTIGIVLIFSQQITPAVVNSVAGILIEFVSILFFNQAKAANQRHDRYHKDLVERHQILQTIQFVKLISTVQDRDKITEIIIRQVLGIDKNEVN